MFNILDVFLIVGVSQGLFLAIALQLIQQKNKEANRILSSLILIACLMLMGRIGWGKIDLAFLTPIGILADTTIFLFGPLLYLYIRRVSSKEEKVFKLGKQHYILALIHLIYFFWYLILPEKTYSNLYQETPLRLFVFFIEVVGLLSCLTYWIRSFLFLNRIKRLTPKQVSFEPTTLRYLQFLLVPLLLCFLFWALSILSYFIPFGLQSLLNYNAVWIAIPFFFYIVGFSSFAHPNLFRFDISVEDIKQETKERLNTESVERNKKKLEHLMKAEKVFINPELSLGILANQLKISPNDLSWLLNNVYNTSFYNFINQFRVNEFIARVEANEHKDRTILAIALDVGFNSKSTFNKFFKTKLNQTPSEYIKTLNIS